MSNTAIDRGVSADQADPSQSAVVNDIPASNFDRGKPDKQSIVSAINQKVRMRCLGSVHRLGYIQCDTCITEYIFIHIFLCI